jgi:integrase
MASMRAVEETPSGRFKVRFRHHGKQTSEVFDYRSDAQRFAQLLAALGPDDARARLDQEQGDAAVPTMDTLAADHIAHLTGVTDGTRVTYERMWERAWHPTLGRIQAHRLTRDDIARAVNRLAQTYAPKSVRNQHSLLSAVCKRAVELGHMRTNLARKVRLPQAVETTEMRILTADEFADVISRIQPAHYRPFVRFLAGTGCRWGEAVALTVADVQLPNVLIRRAVKWSPDRSHPVVGPPKTPQGRRTIAVGRVLHADLRAACEGKAGADLVWTAPRGGPIQHRTFWSDVWLPAVSHLTPRPRIHDLRHSHASHLLAGGAAIYVVQRRLGHRTITTTVDTYGHLLPDAQTSAAAVAELAMGWLLPDCPERGVLDVGGLDRAMPPAADACRTD